MAGPPDERKPVTVLFADLVGSTELATRQDPEQLRAMLAAFFDEMREQIQAFGGTVEKYAGDAIMAVFGVPRVNEDDAERAVRAALAMRQSLEQLNPLFEKDYGVRLDLRVGVATGEAVAAAGATDQSMVTGEVAILAARLQSVAVGVVVSEETYRILDPLLEAEPMRELALKGFPGPVTAYRVTGIRTAGGRPRGIPGLSSPVVGRDAEMRTLRGCIDDLRQGRGQVLSIVGEPGIGKSRLKIEIRESLPEGVRWLEGRCQSFTQSTSYAPLIEVLRSALGVGAADPQPIARTKLRAALRSLAGAQSEQHQTALAHLLGVDLGTSGARALDPRALQAGIIVAVRAVLEGLTQRGPVVLAVEDIHWADAASVELLTIVMELTDRLPLMLLVTCRPETAGEAWTFRFHAERNYPHRLTEIRIAALAPEASQQLAANLLRVSDLQETLRAQVLERAGGNPLFLEEIIRGLAEQGVLRREGDTWVATGDVNRWAIPATLRGVLAARIDALPAEAKRALQRAAVIGRFFTHRALQALSAGDDDLERALAQLLRADLIRESGRDPERRYMVKHALVQDAAYASILAEQRKGLHITVARHLETTLGELGDEHAAILAHHWREAEEWERALHHTLRASARASALYAQPEAVALHWQALELLARLPTTDARRLTYVEVVLELLNLPGWVTSGERRAEGVRHLTEAGRIAGEAGDEDRLARVEGSLGFMHRDEALLLRAIKRARDAGHRRAEAFALFQYLIFLGQSGRFAEALGHAGHLIETYGAEGETFQQALTITAVGRCWAARAGHLDESLAYARQFRAIADEQGDVRLKAWRAMEGEPYFYLGRWDDVPSATGESLPLAWEIGEATPITFGSSWRGLAALKVGRLDEARRVLDRALTLATSSQDTSAFSLAYLTQVRALLHLAEGQLDDALTLARKAIEFGVQSRFRLELGAAQRVLGQVLEASGDREQAGAALAQSLETFEEIQSLPELGQTLLAYGRFKLVDDATEGRRLIARAHDIFARIGAVGWVAEAAATPSSSR
jgi:class 3 adenylate cyclase/tetratricopeptide (TPR) repeat protein